MATHTYQVVANEADVIVFNKPKQLSWITFQKNWKTIRPTSTVKEWIT